MEKAPPTTVKVGNTDVVIPNPVKKVLEIHGRTIVFIYPIGLPHRQLRRNAWCFDKTGRFLWEIQAAPYDAGLDNFWNLAVVRDDRVWLYSARDDRNAYLLDDETGRFLYGPDLPVEEEPDQE